ERSARKPANSHQAPVSPLPTVTMATTAMAILAFWLHRRGFGRREGTGEGEFGDTGSTGATVWPCGSGGVGAGAVGNVIEPYSSVVQRHDAEIAIEVHPAGQETDPLAVEVTLCPEQGTLGGEQLIRQSGGIAKRRPRRRGPHQSTDVGR